MRQPHAASASATRLPLLLGLMLVPVATGSARAAVVAPIPATADATKVAEVLVEGGAIEEDAPKGAADGIDEPGSPAWVSRVENVSYSYAQVLRVDPVAEDVAWRERERQCPGDAAAAPPPPAPVAAAVPVPRAPRVAEPPREGRIASLFGSLVDGLMGRDAVVVVEEPAPVEPAASPDMAPAEPLPAAPGASAPGARADAADAAPAEGFVAVPAEDLAPADAAAADPADPADADADGPDADGCVWVDVDRVETKVVAYDVEYRYRGDIYVSRMRHDPGSRLRIRVAVSPADEPR